MPKKQPTRSEGYVMYDTSLRYLVMLEAIPRSPKFCDAEDLLQAMRNAGYEVSLKTIQRDLQKLKAKFGLESVAKGKKLQWRYKADAKIWMSSNMDENTALVYQMVDMYLKPLLPAKTLDALSPWIMKAKVLLSGRKENTARWSEKVHVMPLGLSRQAPAIRDAVRANVYSALLQETPLEIRYKNRKDEVKTHVFSPLGMIVREGLFYLVAHDENEQKKPIVLAMHRMQTAELKENEKFIPLRGFNLKAFAAEQFAIPMSEQKDIELKIRVSNFSAVNIRECPIAKSQQLEYEDNGKTCLLTATVPNTHELHRWISSLGPHAEVLAPGFLREKFREEYEDMRQRYDGKPSEDAWWMRLRDYDK